MGKTPHEGDTGEAEEKPSEQRVTLRIGSELEHRPQNCFSGTEGRP